MESSEPVAVDPAGQVLPYAPVPVVAEGIRPVPLQLVSLAFTILAFWSAFNYIDVYVKSIGSRCGTPVASAESFVWLVAGAALLESAIACSISKQTLGLATAVRPLMLCTVANVFCILTPWLFGLRAEYWPH